MSDYKDFKIACLELGEQKQEHIVMVMVPQYILHYLKIKCEKSHAALRIL